MDGFHQSCCRAILVVAFFLVEPIVAMAQCCSVSTGSSPTLADYPVSQTGYMTPGSSTVFWAQACDTDTKTVTCGSTTTTYTISDSATVIWTVTTGGVTSTYRGSSFSWTAPALNAGECARTVTISMQADDDHTAAYSSDSTCTGDQNDAPGQTASIQILVAKYDCMTPGSTTLNACKTAVNDQGGCSNGGTKVANPSYTFVVTPPAGQSCSVPANILQTCQGQAGNANQDPDNPCGTASFEAACNAHDAAYVNCSTTKADADQAFTAALTAACNGVNQCNHSCTLPPAITNLPFNVTLNTCNLYASAYGQAMATAQSQQAWVDSQKAACQCCTPPQL